MNERVKNPKVPELPGSSAALAAMRKVKTKQTFNDRVEIIHVKLFDDPDYRKLWAALSNSDAVEKSLVVDNVVAAQRVRGDAKASGYTDIADSDLTAIMKSLGVAARRYGQSRSQRLAKIYGETDQPVHPDEV